MSYAHQGVELKPIPGVAPHPPASTPLRGQVVAMAAPGTPMVRPTVLTQRGAEVLIRIERLMEDASRSLATTPAAVSQAPTAAQPFRPDAVAAAARNATNGAIAGN
jgi:penicillin-binding protein 1A